jgi:hypothetical protein
MMTDGTARQPDLARGRRLIPTLSIRFNVSFVIEDPQADAFSLTRNHRPIFAHSMPLFLSPFPVPPWCFTDQLLPHRPALLSLQFVSRQRLLISLSPSVSLRAPSWLRNHVRYDVTSRFSSDLLFFVDIYTGIPRRRRLQSKGS